MPFTADTMSPVEALKTRIDTRAARVGIIGMGYVGLPLALLFSAERFRVTGFDIDSKKVDILEAGGSYIVRIPASDVQLARDNGFRATSDFSWIDQQDVIVICVPTPLNEYREPDLSYIEKTAEAIGPFLQPHQLVILESTTYPGTTEEILVPILERLNTLRLKALRRSTELREDGFFVAFSPEREDPGRTDTARCDIPKVIGGLDQIASDLAAALYQTIFRRTVSVSTPAAAEMTKLLENIYRCVNIALVNELKMLCLKMGIDIWEVIDAAKTKPFGFQAFFPGPGLGGHCIPVDPFYLSWKARAHDFHTRFIELAGEINTQMPYHVVDAVAKALNRHRRALNGSKVLVLGVAYKKDVDDLRESPSLTIIEVLAREGATVSYNDPYFPTVGRGRHYDLQMTCAPLDNLAEYDCVLIVTDHSAYDYARIVDEAQLVVDSRNATRGISSDKIVHC
jgi:UDP-N-acetyl-D-glucosamine dehydrogenase